MKLRETLHLPLPDRSAAAMYADPEYAAIRRETLGAKEASSHVEGDPAGPHRCQPTEPRRTELGAAREKRHQRMGEQEHDDEVEHGGQAVTATAGTTTSRTVRSVATRPAPPPTTP